MSIKKSIFLILGFFFLQSSAFASTGGSENFSSSSSSPGGGMGISVTPTPDMNVAPEDDSQVGESVVEACSLNDKSLCYEKDTVNGAKKTDEEKNGDGKKDGEDSVSKGDKKPEEDEGPKGLTNEEIARCERGYSNALQTCASAVTSTDSNCDSNNNAAIKNATQVASQSSQKMKTMDSQNGESVLAACQESNKVSQTATSAMQNFRGQCSSSITTCSGQCQSLVSYVQSNSRCFEGTGSSPITSMTPSEATGKAHSTAAHCTSHESKVSEANRAIQNYSANSAKSKDCAGQTKGGESANLAGPANSVGKPGSMTPDYGDKPWVEAQEQWEASAETSTPASAAPRSPASSEGAKNPGSARGVVAPTSVSTSGSGKVAEGQQGSENPVGKSTVKMAAADHMASKETSDLTEKSVDFTGGGEESGRGMNMAGIGIAGEPTEQTADLGNKDKKDLKKDINPDLRGFLPGGIRDPRVAGAAGPDGITGPHSDIWQKIQNRYRTMSPSLLP